MCCVDRYVQFGMVQFGTEFSMISLQQTTSMQSCNNDIHEVVCAWQYSVFVSIFLSDYKQQIKFLALLYQQPCMYACMHSHGGCDEVLVCNLNSVARNMALQDFLQLSVAYMLASPWQCTEVYGTRRIRVHMLKPSNQIPRLCCQYISA